MVIFNTNILIEIYRGNDAVKRNIETLGVSVIYISSITIAEFLVGAKDKADLKRLEKLIGSIFNLYQGFA